MDNLAFASVFLPTGILEHFDITKHEELGVLSEKKVGLFIYLEEKNELPDGYDRKDYESKGFYESVIVQDFPIRGRPLFLVVKRRRWRLKNAPRTEIKSDYSFIANGVKLTQEVADFLKGTGRDPRRYDK